MPRWQNDIFKSHSLRQSTTDVRPKNEKLSLYFRRASDRQIENARQYLVVDLPDSRLQSKNGFEIKPYTK